VKDSFPHEELSQLIMGSACVWVKTVTLEVEGVAAQALMMFP